VENPPSIESEHIRGIWITGASVALPASSRSWGESSQPDNSTIPLFRNQPLSPPM
jgi:hypothetical protein